MKSPLNNENLQDKRTNYDGEQSQLDGIRFKFENIGSSISNFLIEECPTKSLTPIEITSFLEDLKSVIHQNIRGLYATDELLYEKIQSVGSFTSLCRKQIPADEIYFCCLDCDLLSQKDMPKLVSPLQCRHCFYKSNHEGHRVATHISTGNMVCDCGNAAILDIKGFCPNHQGFSSEMTSKMLAQIPSDIEKTYVSTFSELFYLGFRLIEENDLKEKDIHLNLLSLTGESLLAFCMRSESFKLLTSKLLMSSWDEKWLFKHDCNDLEKLRYRKSKGLCKCTILEVLFRSMGYLNDSCQLIFKDLFLELIADYEFRRFFTIISMKMAHFCFIVEVPGEIVQKAYENILQDPTWEIKNAKCSESKTSKLALQLLITEELSLAAATSGYLLQLLDVLRKLLYLMRIKEKINSISTLFHSASTYLLYISSQPAAANVILQNPKALGAIFAVLRDIQSNDRFHLHEFVSAIRADRFNEYQRTRAVLSNRMLEIISALFAQLWQIDDRPFREKIISNLVSLFVSNYKKCKENNENASLFDRTKITMNPILFHMLGILASYLITETPDLNFNDQELQPLWEDALYESMKSLIFFKTLGNIHKTVSSFCRLKPFLMNIHNYHFSAECYSSDYDVLLAQISISMLKDHRKVGIVMKILLNYTTGGANDSGSAALELVWKRTFFEVFTFVMRDESAYARILKRQMGNCFKPASKAEPLYDEIAKKLIINYLHIYHYQTLEEIKNGLNHCIQLANDQHILDSITNMNGQTKKLKLREEWQNKGIDPTIFYKCQSLDRMFQSFLKEATAKDSNFDFLLGSPEPFSLRYLVDVEKTSCLWILSELDLFHDISMSLIEGNVDIAGALRFLALCLKILDKLSSEELEGIVTRDTLKTLREKIQKLALEIETAECFEDYSPFFTKFLKVVEQIEKDLTLSQVGVKLTQGNETEFSVKLQVEDASGDKKAMLLQKQRELMEKFKKRQQDFIANAISVFPETQDLALKEQGYHEKNSIICNYCHETIDTEAEKYGYVAFMARSNFVDYCGLFKEESETRLKNLETPIAYNLWKSPNISASVKAPGYFTISSCYHRIHRDCLELYQNSLDSSEMTETFCPTCRSPYNIFIPLSHAAKSENNVMESLALGDFSLSTLLSTDFKEFFKESDGMNVSKNDDSNNSFRDQLFAINLTITETLGVNKLIEEPEDIVRMMVLQYTEMIEIHSPQQFDDEKIRLLHVCSMMIRNHYWSQPKLYESALHNKFLKLKKNLSKLILSDHSTNEETLMFAKEFIFESKNSTRIILETIWNLYFLERWFPQKSALAANVILFGAVLETLRDFIQDYLLKETGGPNVMESKSHLDINISAFKKYVLEGVYMEELQTYLSYLKKVAVVLSSIGHGYLNNDYKELFQNSSQMLTLLLNLNTTKFSTKDILKEFVVSNENIFGAIFKGISEYIKAKSSLNEIRIFPDGLKASDIAIIPLPESYQEFKGLFLKEKCHLCHEFIGRGVVCLICGKFMCLANCQTENVSQLSGNLNVHARQRHCGITTFVDSEHSIVFLINSPKNAVYRHIYENKYGQRIDRLNQKVDWKAYKLNVKVTEEIKDLLINNQIPQKICRLLEENQNVFEDDENLTSFQDDEL